MKNAKIWLVLDATIDSELGDVLWSIDSAKMFAHIVLGSPRDEWIDRHWTLYTNHAAAKRDAEARLAKLHRNLRGDYTGGKKRHAPSALGALTADINRLVK